ncbi:amidase signature enzyme [Xylariaceae sp. FL1272]|nr:amidase signature enzyme [Xylariaceae sp. FL1272]
METPAFDILRATAAELRNDLETGRLSSVQLIALRIADELDQERRRGCLRSCLHGVPIVLKDCFITAPGLGMTTCAGAVAFANAKARENAVIVQKLVDAGLIVIAKANMTEFSGMKTVSMMPGWSAHGGQTISPYVGGIKENERLLGHSAPGGSSTGPAVSVAAGYAPIAMGAETIGSIVTPSVRMGLYALNPTVGLQSAGGLYRLLEFYDASGPMAKCASDLVDMSVILLGRGPRSSTGWKGLSLAFVDPVKWSLAEEMCEQFEDTSQQMVEEYEAAISKIRKFTGNVKYPVELTEISELVLDGEAVMMDIGCKYWDFKNVTIPEFISSFEECAVPYPNQDQLVKATGFTQSSEHIVDTKRRFRAHARGLLEKTFEAANENVIVAPGDSPVCIQAAAAGYPIAAVPLGQLRYNGRPFGLCLLAKADGEDLLLQFATAFEQLLPSRVVPALR